MQTRIVLELVRNQTQTAVIGAWVSNEGAKIALAAGESEVRAAQVALEGVQKEAQGGQRTTLDVLNSQQDLHRRPRAVDRRPARPGDRVLYPARRHRPARRQDARPQDAGLRARYALPPGSRSLGRTANPVGAIAVRFELKPRD